MSKVVISGIGFVNPYGIGSAIHLKSSKSIIPMIAHLLGAGKTFFHYELPDLKEHTYYPDRKMLRYMRPDAVYAYMAASIALEDADITDINHDNTSVYTGAGKCYVDMWPFIIDGINASMIHGKFDLRYFGKEGNKKVNPFFAIRSLGILPTAVIAEKFHIHGENFVHSSFGAESVEAITQALSDIRSGKTNIALVGGFDYLLNIPEIENMYCNDFYTDDFFGSSSATFIVLEDKEHNKKRNGKSYGEILSTHQKIDPVISGNEVRYNNKVFGSFAHYIPDSTDKIIINPTGTKHNNTEELKTIVSLFSGKDIFSYFDMCGTLLAGAEPFGSALLATDKELKGIGVSLSRSVSGAEAAVIISKEEVSV